MSMTPSEPKKETPRKKPEEVRVEKEVVEEGMDREGKEGEKGQEEMEEKEEMAEKAGEVVESQIAPATPVSTPVQVTPQKDPLTKLIESVLEEDMTDLYLSMTPQTQQLFKAKGEETLSKIRVLLTKTKVNAKKIFQLIREWLKLIPGVNRFFLEQEAKIKTDKILLANEQDKQ